MHEQTGWSLSLGRWGGIHVRLHMFFLLFAACTLYLGFGDGDADGFTIDWMVVQSLGVLLASVLLHEWGHLLATLRLGGVADQIVLGPLGGLTSQRGLRDPAAELMAHLGGPIANFIGCLFCLPVLIATSSNIVGLLYPLAPRGLTEGGTLLVLVKLLFWINWGLLLVNLLPAFPFDGGPMARSLLLIRWPDIGRRNASLIVGSFAKVVAVLIIVAPFLFQTDNEFTLIPTRFAFILLGIFLFFSAQHEERREAAREAEEDLLREFDLAADMEELEREFTHAPERPKGPLKRWIDRRKDLRRQRQQAIEEEEEQCVDEILARVYRHGLDTLTPRERALLERVSARYRDRSHP